jgi:hypothetical protein
MIARSPDRTTSWSSGIKICFTVPFLSAGTTATMATDDYNAAAGLINHTDQNPQR